MKKSIQIILLLIVLGIGSIVLYAAALRPNLIISKADEKARFAQPTSHFLHWRGAEIHYTDEGQGIPLVMIHGFGGSFINWNKLRDKMNTEYRVIRVDLPGFGLSDLPEPEGSKTDYVQQYRDFMTFFIDTLHVDSLYLVGNSMGGMMAWGTAADHPDKVKKLVLIAAAGYDLEQTSANAARVMKIPGMEYLLRRGLPLSTSEGSARKVFCDASKINPETVKNNNRMWNREGNIHAACAIASSGRYPDTALIARVQCPTLIIWGKQDRIVPVEHAERFHRDIKGSEVLLFDTCGHCAMIERADETAAAIKRFFNNPPMPFPDETYGTGSQRRGL
jgi:pimeloyl-ACP methyl ester carboxylesterase